MGYSRYLWGYFTLVSWRTNPLRNGYLGADRSALLEFWSPFPARERLVESQPAQELDFSMGWGLGGRRF